MNIQTELRNTAELLAGGVKIIPVNNKRPICKYKGVDIPKDVIFSHIRGGGLVAFIPWTAGMIVVDIDKGGMASVREVRAALEYLEIALIRSKQSDHFHMLYGAKGSDVVRKGNIYLNAEHRGEALGSTAYAVMHRGTQPYLEAWREKFAQITLQRLQRALHFQQRQQQLAGMPAKPRGYVNISPRKACRPKASLRIAENVSLELLRQARVGERNNALVKILGFVLWTHANRNATKKEATETALFLNKFISEPLAREHVEVMATHLWETRQGGKSEYSEHKREKQRIGVERRRVRHGLDDRDISIHDLAKDGVSQRQIAKQFGLSVCAVQSVLAKPCPVIISLFASLKPDLK